MKTNARLIAVLVLTLPGFAASAVQTDWSGGSGEPGPVSSWGDAFDDYRGLDWSETGELTLVDDHAVSRTVDSSYTNAASICTGDIDGDGDEDLVASAFVGNEVVWWANDGSGGGWTQHLVDDGLTGPWTVNSADMDSDGDLDVLGNDRTDGEVYWWELTTDHRSGGWLEGSLLDTGTSDDWGEITWDCQAPSGTSLEVEVRAGDQVYDLGDWMSIATSGDDLSAYLADGLRYIQYRVSLSTTDPALTPVLEEIELEWQSSSDLEDVELGVRTSDDGPLVSWTVHGDVPAGLRVLRESGGRRDPLTSWLDGGRRAYLDRGVEPGEDYRYWLEVRDDAGRSTLYGPSQNVILPEPSSTLTLEEPYPSPAIDTTTITFTLPSAQRANLAVYDLAGRRVAALTAGELAAGRHQVVWSCQDEHAGVYLLRLETQTGALTRRLVVSR
jgi:hypothetical protein